MTQLFLTDEQANAIRHANGTIALCDPSGAFIGYVNREVHFTPEEIAEAKRRGESPGPWYTTAEVLSHLRALEQE